MLLNQLEFIEGGYLNYLERYVNDGSISGFTQKYTTSDYTNPFVGDQNFYLYTCSVRNDWIITIGEVPNFLKSNSTSSDFIFIHPDMAKDFTFPKADIKKSDYKAIPTSSSRTVHLQDYDNFFIKMHYNGIIGRIKRDLTNKHGLASVDLTNIIKDALNKFPEFDNVCILPEIGAKIVYNKENNYNFGMVVRENNPYGSRSQYIKYMIPAFSFFSKDRKHPDDPAILSQLIKNSNEPPSAYLLNRLLIPLVKVYFNFIRILGLQLELHTQNFLIGLDEDWDIVAFIMKDMESIDIDKTMREKLGLKTQLRCYPYKHIDETQYNYLIKHSFMFDYKLCQYTFIPLIESVCNDFNLKRAAIIDKVKEVVNEEIALLPKGFFPSDWYVFKKVLIDRSTPYRPYVNKGIPIFRD